MEVVVRSRNNVKKKVRKRKVKVEGKEENKKEEKKAAIKEEKTRNVEENAKTDAENTKIIGKTDIKTEEKKEKASTKIKEKENKDNEMEENANTGTKESIKIEQKEKSVNTIELPDQMPPEPHTWDVQQVSVFVRSIGKGSEWATYSKVIVDECIDGDVFASANAELFMEMGFTEIHANLVEARLKTFVLKSRSKSSEMKQAKKISVGSASKEMQAASSSMGYESILPLEATPVMHESKAAKQTERLKQDNDSEVDFDMIYQEVKSSQAVSQVGGMGEQSVEVEKKGNENKALELQVPAHAKEPMQEQKTKSNGNVKIELKDDPKDTQDLKNVVMAYEKAVSLKELKQQVTPSESQDVKQAKTKLSLLLVGKTGLAFEGNRVVSVKQSSEGAIAGIKAGWILNKLNGNQISHSTDLNILVDETVRKAGLIKLEFTTHFPEVTFPSRGELGLVLRGGRVIKVVRESVAHKLGVKPGWAVRAVDDCTVDPDEMKIIVRIIEAREHKGVAKISFDPNPVIRKKLKSYKPGNWPQRPVKTICNNCKKQVVTKCKSKRAGGFFGFLACTSERIIVHKCPRCKMKLGESDPAARQRGIPRKSRKH